MSKVIFVIVPSCSDSEWLNTKMLQVTKTFIWILAVEHRYPIVVVDTYNDINQYLDKADYLVVSTAGNVLVDIEHIRKKIHAIPEDVGVIGHLLQYNGNITPWMHEQFFIINTKAVTSVNLTTSIAYDVGPEIIRSEADLHGGWAPLTVSLGNRVVPRELRFGTLLIQQCLENGYKVMNFDNSWRYSDTANDYVASPLTIPCRGFCYPTENTFVFEKSLKELKLYPGLNDAQEMVISILQQVLNFNVLNVWNNDTVPEDVIANHVISPANGFLGELLALASGARSITFYDKNRNNIDFKKYLYTEWNGSDYEALALAWADKYKLAVEPVFEVDKNKCKKWIDIVSKNLFVNWIAWRNNITVKFVYCDLVKDVDIITDDIKPGTILHTSTILSIFPFTAFVHDERQIQYARNHLENKVKALDSVWIET